MTKRVNKKLLAIFPAVAFFMVTFVMTPSTAEAQAKSFRENFNRNELPSKLDESGGSPEYAGGVVTFRGWEEPGRRYLRTKANYNSTSFIAEVTVTVPGGYGGYGVGFFGVGAGFPYCGYYGEPRVSPTIYTRFFPFDFGGAEGSLNITNDGQENVWGVNGAAGDGTHRVRITWNHLTKQFTVAIHQNYDGGPFVPTTTSEKVFATDSFGNNNSRIFFGGTGVYDDLVVIALHGKPADTNCHGENVSALSNEFGGIAKASSALGFPSVAALQQVITDFCGNY